MIKGCWIHNRSSFIDLMDNGTVISIHSFHVVSKSKYFNHRAGPLVFLTDDTLPISYAKVASHLKSAVEFIEFLSS